MNALKSFKEVVFQPVTALFFSVVVQPLISRIVILAIVETTLRNGLVYSQEIWVSKMYQVCNASNSWVVFFIAQKVNVKSIHLLFGVNNVIMY